MLLRKHMIRLTIWSAATLFLGLAGIVNPVSQQTASFSEMLAGWSVINLLIAVPGLRKSTRPIEPARFKKLLFFNQWVNVLFVTAGILWFMRGTPDAQGSGLAVAIQGCALLLLDGYLYFSISTASDLGDR